MKRRIFLPVLCLLLTAFAFGCACALIVVNEYSTGKISTWVSLAVPLCIVACGVCALVAAVLAICLTSGFSRRICEIEESLKSLNAGEYRPLVTDSRDEELYSVLCQINDLNRKTHKYIRKQAEQKQKLAVVLENIHEGIVALDGRDKIIFSNSRALDIFACRKIFAGAKLSYLIPDSGLCDKISSCGEPMSVFDFSRDGRAYILRVSKTVQAEESSGISRIIVIADVTKEKSIAKQKSDFFANASHELKTPITVMQGHSELLLAKGTLAESETKQIMRIHKECVRLSDLISDMLKLSNLERREQEPACVEVNVRAVCDEVLSELSEMTEKRGIIAEVEGEGNVSADPKRIYELIGNLCTNAVKYNKDGGSIWVDISDGEDAVVIKVSDAGIGIPAEHIPRICERFYRVDKSRSKKTGGTGLGLAIVKHICVLYGAELKIESEVDIGTTVSVSFPK